MHVVGRLQAVCKCGPRDCAYAALSEIERRALAWTHTVSVCFEDCARLAPPDPRRRRKASTVRPVHGCNGIDLRAVPDRRVRANVLAAELPDVIEAELPGMVPELRIAAE